MGIDRPLTFGEILGPSPEPEQTYQNKWSAEYTEVILPDSTQAF